MEITIGKLFSLGVALAGVVASMVMTKEVGFGLGLAAIYLFPLSLIWFPDEWGERIAGRISSETPAVIVALGGWILLIGLPFVLYYMGRQR